MKKEEIHKNNIYIKIHGLVQGVFFRTETQKTAQKLELSGWVKNMPDGTIKIVAEGPKEKLLKLKQWCETGSEYARVEKIETNFGPAINEFKKFEIRY